MIIKQCEKCGRLAPIPPNQKFCFDCAADEVVEALNHQFKPKEENMAKKGVCEKCRREITIYAKGLCHKCYKEEYGKPGKKENGGSLKITLDFSPYPELYEALKEKAREEFRDVAHQALWCIQHYVRKQELLSGKEV